MKTGTLARAAAVKALDGTKFEIGSFEAKAAPKAAFVVGITGMT